MAIINIRNKKSVRKILQVNLRKFFQKGAEYEAVITGLNSVSFDGLKFNLNIDPCKFKVTDIKVENNKFIVITDSGNNLQIMMDVNNDLTMTNGSFLIWTEGLSLCIEGGFYSTSSVNFKHPTGVVMSIDRV